MDKIPSLRFKEFSGEWEEIKLKEILEFKNGINAPKEQYGKGIKFINVLDILNNDFITYNNIIGKVDIDEKTLEKYSVNYGDVLFQRSSETREEVGMANVYLDDKIATFGGFVIRGKKIANYVPTFINKVLKTDLARNEITSKSGGSTRYNVGQDILNEVQIIIPNLEEQEKIGNFLSSVDKKISIVEEKLNLFNEYKKGIMQKIFNQELRFKDENGNNYPQWEEKKLGDIGTFFSGGTPKSDNKKYYNGDIPFIKSGEISKDKTEQFITKLGLDNSSAKMVKKGDLLFALYGATSGECAISKINGAINQAVLVIRTEENTIFLFNYFKFYKDNIIKKFLQGGQGNLSAEIIKMLNINFPCLEEQKKIADFLSAIDDKIENISDNLESLKLFKKSMLQKMFV